MDTGFASRQRVKTKRFLFLVEDMSREEPSQQAAVPG
jgi:hypothetical protein